MFTASKTKKDCKVFLVPNRTRIVTYVKLSHRRRLLDKTHVPLNEVRMWPLALKGQNFSTEARVFELSTWEASSNHYLYTE